MRADQAGVLRTGGLSNSPRPDLLLGQALGPPSAALQRRLTTAAAAANSGGCGGSGGSTLGGGAASVSARQRRGGVGVASNADYVYHDDSDYEFDAEDDKVR